MSSVDIFCSAIAFCIDIPSGNNNIATLLQYACTVTLPVVVTIDVDLFSIMIFEIQELNFAISKRSPFFSISVYINFPICVSTDLTLLTI